MPTFKRASVHILVDGKRLPEYKAEYDATNNIVTCHVPSETEKVIQILILRVESNQANLTDILQEFRILVKDKSPHRKNNTVITNVGVVLDGWWN